MTVSCPDCKKTFTAETRDELAIRPGETLPRAYARILAFLQAGTGEVHHMTGFNQRSPAASYAKFLVSRDQEGSSIFVLGERAWDASQEQVIINQLLAMWEAFLRKGEPFPRVRILNLAQVPAMAAYLFSNEARGVFETLCMLKFRAPYAVDPSFARDISDHVRWLLKTYWSIDIDVGRPEHSKLLEDYLVNTIRGRTGPEDTIEGLEYWPRHTLLGLGCVAGEMVCRHPRLHGRWIEDEEVPFQLGVEIGLRGSPQVHYTDPIGKLCMLFEDGVANSVRRYVLDLPQLLKELGPAEA
jgi:hypothetical protein